MGTSSIMAGRRSPRSNDLVLELSRDERRAIDAAADEERLPSSTWLRRVALSAAETVQASARRRAAGRRMAARLRAEFERLPDATAHAERVERARRGR
jgi:hypothetical protein